MIDTPKVTRTSARLTAVIHLTIPRAEMQTVMGPGLREVMGAIADQGIAAAGPWFTHHLRMAPDIFDFEICVPVTAPVSSVGRVRPSEWPAMEVVRTMYHGPYQGLGSAWGELDSWVAANGFTPAEDLWECYLAGPESSPDPSQWRTELNRPLIR